MYSSLPNIPFQLPLADMHKNRHILDYTVGSSDFDIFLEIQYASCVFGLALES